jgi:hypothetical protein
MYRVINDFNGHKIGDIIELNDRRAKSELRNGNIEMVFPKIEHDPIVKKIEKRVYENKAYKKPVKRKK